MKGAKNNCEKKARSSQVKRGPGRPRKHPLMTAAASPPVAKRGQPRSRVVSPPKESPNQTERRGSGDGFPGRWISTKEAKKYVDFSKVKGPNDETVEVKQYDPDGPTGRPIWRYENNDMYLGEWKEGRDGVKREHTSAECDAIIYNHAPDKVKGKMYIGQMKDGMCHGSGTSFWLESAPVWKSNILESSEIKRRGHGRPYTYVGDFKKDQKHCKDSIMTLKSTKKGKVEKVTGAWEHGEKVGPWSSMSEDVVMDEGDEESLTTGPVSMTTEERIKSIADWLGGVIGYDPDEAVMEEYAKQLIKLGLHSVEFIVDRCSKKDVTGFWWMAKFHRERIIEEGGLKRR